MANVFRTVGRVVQLDTVDPQHGTAVYILGDASDGIVGTFCLHVVNTNAMAASIIVRARSRMPQANDDNVPFEPIPYLALYLNGAVGDMLYHTAPITGESIVLVPATGLDIALDCTVTGGIGKIYWVPAEGAAA